jgi:NADP-dependent 3-hydroxy acid dehydrogenase YdfG
MNLENKIAIVTGVSQGIGKATAELLLKHNVKVVGWSRSAPFGITHPNFYYIGCDVSDINSVAKAFNSTLGLTGEKIDILINNAGLGYFRMMEEITLDEWNEMFDVNVKGTFLCCKAFLPLMKKNKSGHIINIASIAALQGLPEGTGYCASKFAVRGFSQSLFKEARPHNVKVSCVFPGSVKTNFFKNYEAITPNDDMMKPEDIAASLIHIIETPENILPAEIELRPMRVKL